MKVQELQNQINFVWEQGYYMLLAQHSPKSYPSKPREIHIEQQQEQEISEEQMALLRDAQYQTDLIALEIKEEIRKSRESGV